MFVTALIFSTLTFAASPASAVKCTRVSPVMIVMDASGSMAKRIRKKRRIDIAKQVIEELMQRWDPRVPVGLSAYGHRRKKDCKDIETLVAISKANRATMRDAAKKLRPRGHTPISASLRHAAEQIGGGKGVIVLVSDGKETCNEDPAAAAKKLRQRGLTVHVVNFGGLGAEREQLQAVAKSGGGFYFEAKDKKALIDSIELASCENEVTKKVRKSAPGVFVRLRLGREGPILLPPRRGRGQAMRYEVNMWLTKDTGQPRWRRFTQREAVTAAGCYRARMKVGLPPQVSRRVTPDSKGILEHEESFCVAEEERGIRLVELQGGLVELLAPAPQGSFAFRQAYWTIYPAGSDAKAKPLAIALAYGRTAEQGEKGRRRDLFRGTIVLPAGAYRATLRWSLVNRPWRQFKWTAEDLASAVKLPIIDSKRLEVVKEKTHRAVFSIDALTTFELPRHSIRRAAYVIAPAWLAQPGRRDRLTVGRYGQGKKAFLAPGKYRVSMVMPIGSGSKSSVAIGEELVTLAAKSTVASKMSPSFHWVTASCEAAGDDSSAGYARLLWTVFRKASKEQPEVEIGREPRYGGRGCLKSPWRVPLAQGRYRFTCRETVDGKKRQFAGEATVGPGRGELSVKLR